MNITFVPVFPQDQAIRGLRPGKGQEGFIETVDQCLREADELPLWRPVAIMADGKTAGFAMYGLWDEEGENGRVWLDRFLIDARYQGKGIARAALPLLLDRLFDEYGRDTLYLSVYAGNTTAEHLFTSVGFRFTGEADIHGERVMALRRPARIRRAGKEDAEETARLAQLLWPCHTKEELIEEIAPLLTSPEASFFLAEEEGEAVGFAQCQLRHDYVEGTQGGGPVGYLEGVFVEEPFRRRGVGRLLTAACEKWAAGQGCREFASDCELANEQSLRFHLGSGFREANRIICFVKELG